MKKYHSTILIVDDDANDRLFIERAFNNLGMNDPVHTVASGQEAIAYMTGEGKYSDRDAYAYPTFITTDLKMPGTDGFAVLEHLKRRPEWAIIPTVVLSSSNDLDDIRRAYGLGASSYHIKPANLSELNKLVRVLHDYWMTCEVPLVDASGHQLPTVSRGKLGARLDLSR